MLHVGERHVIFESGSALSEIFYDDVNKKVQYLEINGVGRSLNGNVGSKVIALSRLTIFKITEIVEIAVV